MAFDYAYGKTLLGELQLHGVHHEDSAQFHLTGVTIDGQLVIPSRGFVKSLCKHFTLSRHLQENRTPGELLSLIVRSFPLAEVEYRIEWDETGTTWLFAKTSSFEAEAVLDQPAPEDIPSPVSRLAEYGFKPLTTDSETVASEATFSSADDQDWPLLRDMGCEVPAFPFIPDDHESKVTSGLFISGPAGTPRPSVN